MLAKAFWEDRSGDSAVKYAPGDAIPDDHPKREWLIKSGIAAPALDVVEDSNLDDVKVDVDDMHVPIDDAPALDVVEDSGKPKPTDSIEKHREYATKHGIDPKGLSRAQLVKAIRDL